MLAECEQVEVNSDHQRGSQLALESELSLNEPKS